MHRPVTSYPVLSSVFLALLMLIDKIWSIVFVALSLLIFVYKGLALPYPTGPYAYEIIILILYLPVALVRLFLGDMGNELTRAKLLVWFLVLTVPVLAANVYYLILQIYVFSIDVALNGLSLIIIMLDTVVGLVTAINFCRYV
eukprot:EC787502.1.p1 GENE.EC787502.1~~EC787502.1.p1  ORF type:complete len:154 (+),score=39.65 EC787502.1:34-462(+)